MAAEMTVIMGRAGTGKTHYMMTKIAENEKKGLRSALIVPERATYETERQLSELLGGGIIYTYVLSFKSLAARVLKEKGNGRRFLTQQGRQMLIRRAVEENKDKLIAFAGIANHKGFTEECDGIISNCKKILIEPETLKTAGEEFSGNLGAKLQDFALIYNAVNEFMYEKYIDSEDIMNSLIENIPDSSLQGMEIFIDAPEALNATTLRIIDTLMDTVKSITVSLRYDTHENCQDRRLFGPDQELYLKLKEICAAKNQKIRFIPFEEQRGTKPPALLHLERNLFAYSYKKYLNEAPEIEIDAETDRVNEVRAAAEAILNEVRNGMRYREIAVITTDPDEYENIIKRVFSTYDIPFFSEGGRSVSTHPVAELLLAALRCVEKGFRANDFIRVFKTGFMGISRENAEKLENHILKYGLNGSKLTEPFTQEEIPFGVEEARRKTAEPLLKLKTELGGRQTANKRIQALYDFITDIKLPEKLKNNCEELNAMNRLDLARETAQIYDTVVTLLDQLYVILGEETLSIKKFSAIVEEGLNAYSVSIIPTTLDQVIVGDIERTELNDSVKFLIVLGMNAEFIPNMRKDNNIINDSDLARMKKAGLPVWNNTEKINCQETLHIYSMLTKARERLRFSYCTDIFGTSADPSPLILKLCDIFPKCRITNGLKTPLEGNTLKTAFPLLISRIRNMIESDAKDNCAKELYAAFYSLPEYRGILERIGEAYYSDTVKTPLGNEEINKLYGKSITGTPTRLETFNQCPYRFFLQYGMKLKEREKFEEKNNDKGSFYHEALEKFVDGLLDDDIDFDELTREDVAERLENILNETVQEHNNGIFLSTARMRAEFQRIMEQLFYTGWAIVCQLAEGRFRPMGSEISFGRKDDVLPALIIKAENGATFSVCGIVDRMDGVHCGGKDYMRIIDYKSGNVDFDFAELANGLKLQLPLYASAMEAAFKTEEELKTAGFYYLHLNINDWDIDMENETEESLRKMLLKDFKLKGLTIKDEEIITSTGKPGWHSRLNTVKNVACSENGEISGSVATFGQMDKTLAFAREKAASTLESIMKGIISVNPSEYRNKNDCRFCPFGSVCRFDPTNGNRFRSIKEVAQDVFFKNISRDI